MYRIDVVAIALIGFLTPYLTLNQEAFAQSSQSRHRSLSGVWKKTPVPFHGDKSGCHAGSDGSSNPPTPREITLVQNGTSVSIRGNFASASGGYNSGGSGEVKGNQFTLTDSGGGFTVQYTGTISDDGKTITGQALCRYGSGSATATGSFTWTRKGETKRIKVWLTGFIPTRIVDIGLPARFVGDKKCSHGDGRGFNRDFNEEKYRFRDVVEFEVKVQGEKVTDIRFINRKPDTGETRLVDCKTQEVLPGPGHRGYASTDGMRYASPQLESNRVKVGFAGKLKHPLIPEAASIDYNLEVTIDPIGETVTVFGLRDSYPAYELYASFRDENQPEQKIEPKIGLQKMPSGWSQTPWDLYAPPTVVGDPPPDPLAPPPGPGSNSLPPMPNQDRQLRNNVPVPPLPVPFKVPGIRF